MAQSKKCEFCGTDKQDGNTCVRCGAKLPEAVNVWKSEPFFYNGYIVYCLRDCIRDQREIQFWLGHDLIQHFIFTRIAWDEFITRIVGGEMCDYMPYLFDMLKLTQGEKEVMEIQAKNTKEPARFEIRYICPERERLSKNSLSDFAAEAIKAITEMPSIGL